VVAETNLDDRVNVGRAQQHPIWTKRDPTLVIEQS
jgi:hypothetical protein